MYDWLSLDTTLHVSRSEELQNLCPSIPCEAEAHQKWGATTVSPATRRHKASK